MKRLIVLLLGALALLVPVAPAAAQTVSAKTVWACGTPGNTPVVGNPYPVTMDTTGVLCTNAPGGVAGLTAEAVASAVAAGTNKPQSEDTVNGAARTEICVPSSTTCYDPTTPGGVLGKNGSSIATSANGLPVDLSLNGAVPSLTNPIFIANAEAADATGTFTNATQTTSVTNSSADGYATSLITITGTYGTATGVFEASPDSGTTWASIICSRSDGSASETGYTGLTNTTRQWICATAGNDSVRVRSTAVASGTVNVNLGISAPPSNNGVVSGAISVPATATGGAGMSHAIVAANTTSVAIDASPGTLYSVQVFNNSATIAYLKLYDAAQGSTTCGSGTPKKVVLIPASTSGAGAVIFLGGASGVAFATAITRCVTTGIADNDTGAPAATTYLVEADFK